MCSIQCTHLYVLACFLVPIPPDGVLEKLGYWLGGERLAFLGGVEILFPDPLPQCSAERIDGDDIDLCRVIDEIYLGTHPSDYLTPC